MDVREKLVELLCEAQHIVTNTNKAEYLAEHGVTVADNLSPSEPLTNCQQWIPVNDRLPENFVSVLGYMTDAGEFPSVRECYTVGNAFFFPALGDIHPVSHWCEMPQPPKGE